MNERRGFRRKLPRRQGRCELCAKRDAELQMLMVGDFSGWACAECCSQLRKMGSRKYCGTAEETEPAE